MKQHRSSTRSKPGLARKLPELRLNLEERIDADVWVRPTALICIGDYQHIQALSARTSESKWHSCGSAPTLGCCIDSLALQPGPRWLIWGALQRALTSSCCGLPSLGNRTQTDEHARWGSFCTVGSNCALNISENSCGRRSLPDVLALPPKVGPRVVWLWLHSIKKNANQIRNTSLSSNNLHLDTVGRKLYAFNYSPPLKEGDPSTQQWHPFSPLFTLFISPYYCSHKTSVFKHGISLSNKMQQEVPQVNYKLV